MFESIPLAKADAILEMMLEFRTDERSNKIDLGVGIYKDNEGATPIMQAVRLAEASLHESQTTKSYVGPAGDPAFCTAMNELVFGANHDRARIRSMQTPGGSGALRMLGELLHAVNPTSTLWLSDPTWPNHLPILQQAGHELAHYAYYNADTNSVDFDGMVSSLSAAKSGDIVLLHGCCHNPTGADLTLEQWRTIGNFCHTNNLIPFVDLAYQGFGDGLEEDVAGLRILAQEVPEMVVAASCSKNFSLYRERAGAAFVVAANADAADRGVAQLSKLVRSCYSMPPDHGAALATLILNDTTLSTQWKSELDSMRSRIQQLRQAFADALRRRSNSDQFDYIAHQRGMFSRLPLTQAQVDKLRIEDGIYMVGDGRINVAGLPENDLDLLAEKIIARQSQ